MIINMHEHPGPAAEEHQARYGIDVSVLLPVGDAAQHRQGTSAGCGLSGRGHRRTLDLLGRVDLVDPRY